MGLVQVVILQRSLADRKAMKQWAYSVPSFHSSLMYYFQYPCNRFSLIFGPYCCISGFLLPLHISCSLFIGARQPAHATPRHSWMISYLEARSGITVMPLPCDSPEMMSFYPTNIPLMYPEWIWESAVLRLSYSESLALTMTESRHQSGNKIANGLQSFSPSSIDCIWRSKIRNPFPPCP